MALLELVDVTPIGELQKPFPIRHSAFRLTRKPRTKRDCAELLRHWARFSTTSKSDREFVEWVAGVLDGTDSPAGARL
jgi:hypothetical protein